MKAAAIVYCLAIFMGCALVVGVVNICAAIYRNPIGLWALCAVGFFLWIVCSGEDKPQQKPQKREWIV